LLADAILEHLPAVIADVRAQGLDSPLLDGFPETVEQHVRVCRSALRRS
jgi:hypothetical protein